MQERLALAHLVGVEHGPAEQPADDVALLLGARPDVLMDAEGERPGVVGGPADADAVERVLDLGVVHAERLGRGGDDGPEEVDLEVRLHALKRGGGPFQAHAGVDVLLGQGLELPGPEPVELGEDQVPDLHLLDAVAVVEDLGAGAADAVGTVRRSARGPEVVVLAHPGDPVRRDADLLVPDVEGLVVVEVDGEGEALAGDLQDVGQELPGPVDGLALEVVAEAEVAQHLEEGHVPRGLAHVLDVAGPDAFLAGRGALEAGVAQAHELALELVHAGRREEHGRVVGHEHVAGAADAALGGEVIEIGFAKFVGFHGASGSVGAGRSGVFEPCSAR